jgi:glycosyltransferase involved in cell wall biosynthesis
VKHTTVVTARTRQHLRVAISPFHRNAYNRRVPRLAWFTPLPPARSGVAAYSAEVLPLLAGDHEIDVFVDQRTPEGMPAHDFVWKHLRAPYDLIVYQLGNSPAHDYMWPYLTRYPGLIVLHDGQLHHSRAKALLSRGRTAEYREELRFSHPEASASLATLVVANLAGALFYDWRMLGVAARSARLLAVHSAWLQDDLSSQFSPTPVERIRMGVADPLAPTGQGKRNAGLVRARLRLPPDGVVFAAFGGVTPEKRIRQIIGALAAIRRARCNAYLVLAGEPAPYYDALADARAWGIEDRIRLTGYVPEEDLPAYLEATDVCLCLRWPTTRETSAAWLRCLAAGKASISTDLVQNDETPSLDPRTWTTASAAAPPADADSANVRTAVCVSIDILDEDHSLILAMRRLAVDAALRADLGRRARMWWERSHRLEHMAADYRRVIARAQVTPVPDLAGLPAHLRKDGTALARQIVATTCGSDDVLAWD